VQRLGRDLLAAVAPDDVVQDVHRAALGGEHAGHGLDGLRPDGEALLHELGELLEHDPHLAERSVVALDGDLVAAQVHLAAEALGDRVQQAIAVGAELLCELVGDGKAQRCHLHQGYSRPLRERWRLRERWVKLWELAAQASRSRTSACTRLPSARPPAAAIASRMTPPMSFMLVAPVFAMAASTMPASSSSDSAAGRNSSMSAAS